MTHIIFANSDEPNKYFAQFNATKISNKSNIE